MLLSESDEHDDAQEEEDVSISCETCSSASEPEELPTHDEIKQQDERAARRQAAKKSQELVSRMLSLMATPIA